MRGADVYKMWHQKPVKEVIEIAFVLPRRLTRMGQANRIVYESDKWEEDGEVYPYQHEFTSSPDTFIADPEGEIDTRDFLEMDDLDDFVLNWIHLGCVAELRVKIPGQKKKRNIVFEDGPLMCRTAEKDTLIVLHHELMFVRGGTMVITDRGIVN